MRRFPIFATLVVILAVGTMIGLGVWQIHRAQWKEALLATYRAAQGAPLLDGIPAAAEIDRIAFRRSRLACTIATAATPLGGSSRTGERGFRNIAGCRLPDHRMIMVDLGWNSAMATPTLPMPGQRIEGIGRLIPDEVLARRVIGTDDGVVPLLFVTEHAAPGLLPSQPPAITDIPNNHRSYAVQWFLFAGVALVIFVIAALQRQGRRRIE